MSKPKTTTLFTADQTAAAFASQAAVHADAIEIHAARKALAVTYGTKAYWSVDDVKDDAVLAAALAPLAAREKTFKKRGTLIYAVALHTGLVATRVSGTCYRYASTYFDDSGKAARVWAAFHTSESLARVAARSVAARYAAMGRTLVTAVHPVTARIAAVR